MAYHPLNLAVRFVLEIAALVALGYWGFDRHEGVWRFVLGIGLPLLAAAAWGIFAVPGDRSRSGKAPVPIPGWVRSLLELAFFALAAWALCGAGKPILALVLAGITIVHYAASYDRVAWLASNSGTEKT
jgi:drug/metabolite transporter (DMT)-like permease